MGYEILAFYELHMFRTQKRILEKYIKALAHLKIKVG